MRKILLLQTITLFLGVIASPYSGAADPLRIENALYGVECDPSTGAFTIRSKGSGKIIASRGTTGSGEGTGSISTLRDPVFGSMPAIRVVHPDGGSENIALPAKIPFVLFSSELVNPGEHDLTLNKVPGVTVDLDPGNFTVSPVTLGTAGLLPPAKNPGSYTFLAVADPERRSGVIGGWITQNRSSGIVFSPSAEGGGVRIKACSEYGRLLMKPGSTAKGELFALGSFDDVLSGLEDYGDMVALVGGVRLPPRKPGHCTWYMDKHAAACDETHLAELAAFAEKNLKPWGLDFLQIDDHWQSGTSTNGPKRNFMEHDPKGPYPSGMKAAAAMIASHGFTPGIWFIPFAGTYSDPFFHAHPDWFVKDAKGAPYEVGWGGTCLDMTAREPRDYVKGLVSRVTKDWGYRLLKLDGFWTGSGTKLTYVNNGYTDDGMGNATFADPSKPNVEAMRDGVSLVRSAAGPDVFLLGCCLSQNMRSMAGSLGLVDAMRVGPDSGAGQIGSLQASRLWFLNGRVWWNDPDCVSVRSSVSVDQARLNASFAAVSGAMFLNSDWIPDLTKERLDILRHCMPLHDLHARPVDVLEREPASVWHLADTRKEPRRDILAMYNWSSSPSPVKVNTAKSGLPQAAEYVAFDFWAGKFVPPFHDGIGGMMGGKTSRVLAVRPVSGVPQLLSTSRHITQGMVDVSGEKWDSSSSMLRGSCDVVAADPDELRIVVPSGNDSWVSGNITLSEEDRKAGVTASMNQQGPRIRVTLVSPVSRTVRWEIPFKKGSAMPSAPSAVTGLKAEADYHGVKLSWVESGEDRYRVTRDDGFTIETASSRFDDEGTDASSPRTYTVCSLGWDGAEGAPSVVTTPRLPARPKDPPKPTIGLEKLASLSSKPRIGSSVDGKQVSVDGRHYPKGLGLRTPDTLVYTVPPGSSRFVGVAGLDDGTPSGAFTVEVKGDVKEMGEKPQTLSTSPVLGKGVLRSWPFDITLDPRIKEIHLIITPSAGGSPGLPVDWVDAGFIKQRP
jgi:NPCBM/NEW2 domain/Melibiase